MKVIPSPEYIRDALYNIVPNSGASDEYCYGIVLGIVSTLMGYGMKFLEATEYLKSCLPPVERRRELPRYIPDTWLGFFKETPK